MDRWVVVTTVGRYGSVVVLFCLTLSFFPYGLIRCVKLKWVIKGVSGKEKRTLKYTDSGVNYEVSHFQTDYPNLLRYY